MAAVAFGLVAPCGACGRFGFENVGFPSDASNDAVSTVNDGEIEFPTTAGPDADVADSTAAPDATTDAAVSIFDATVSTDASVDAATSRDATVVADAAMDATGQDASASITLRHWYRFDGTGTVITDSIGTATGESLGGASLSGSGTIALSGGTSERYVNLPNRLISTLSSVSIEVWMVWNGAGGYQRIFDFGANDVGEGSQGIGTTQFSLAIDGTSPGTLRLLFDADPRTTSDNWRVVWGFSRLTSGVLHQLVATFDAAPSPNVMALYLDGVLVSSATVVETEGLAAIDDVNVWLGRAQAFADPELAGVLHDARIYEGALSSSNVASRFTLGPDSL